MLKPILLAATASLAATGAGVAQDGEARIEFGVLRCEMTGRTNLVIVSETQFACVFDHAGDRPDEGFTAVIDKLGVDLSLKAEEVLVWGVLAPSLDAPVAGLEGTYVGVGADAALGAGIGANALVGGMEKSFALQPVSVTGSEGIGATLAVQALELRYTGQL